MILTGQALKEAADDTLTPGLKVVNAMSVDIHLGGSIEIAPGDFETVVAYETFSVPNDIACLLTGRSRHMRQGINTPMGWIDPGMSGEVVLEYFNMSNEKQELEFLEAGARLVFFQLQQETEGYDGKWSQ